MSKLLDDAALAPAEVAAATDPPRDPVAKNQFRLKLYFAILSCLGGLVLASGEGTEIIPVIAVFFAVFGFVFVDWLKLFALPSVAAYLLMGVAAIYCVSDFWNLKTPGNQQMLSVAQLLVFVQAILMLQKKTPRIFEQLGVFCLLELVVAAVFNDAIVYGALLIPIGLIGVWALALLSSLAPGDQVDASISSAAASVSKGARPRQFPLRPAYQSPIRHSSARSSQSMAYAASRMRRFAMWTLAPAAILVGAVFFYALPRTTDAARMEGTGTTLVGFDDQMRLEQIGQMLQSSEPALRVRLSDRRSGRSYAAIGGMYLRGKVLEQYKPQIGNRTSTATWSSSFRGSSLSQLGMPPEYFSPLRSDRNFFDSVNVEITCESMRSASLFAIAPYFATKRNTEIAHADGRWTLSRRDKGTFVYPRIRYQFGTHAFRGGVQADKIAAKLQFRSRFSLSSLLSATEQAMLGRQIRPQRGSYVERLLQFDQNTMPTAARIANEIKDAIPPADQTDVTIARAIEQHLAVTGGYQYTLNLTATAVAGMDPIEQFLAVDRRGHCQYFASAMVMMLRSLGIPARVVVGYRTEEFNEIGQYYLARQSHAHAWVEALLPKSELGDDGLVYGQPETQEYWVRLDPTPGGGGVTRAASGGVDQVLSLAKDIWEEYVVDMDARRQNKALTGDDGEGAGAFGSAVRWIQQKIAAIRAQGLGGGSLAIRDVFSWRGAAVGILLAATLIVLMKLRIPRFSWRRSRQKAAMIADKPQIPFYADALDQLARLDVKRAHNQTPSEFADYANRRLDHPATTEISRTLGALTSEFCRQRYGHGGDADTDVETTLTELTNQVDTALNRPDAQQLEQKI